MDSLADALPKEIARIRDEVIPIYESIGPTSIFAVTLMKADMDAAARAMVEGDVVEMLRLYKELKSYNL